MFLTGEVDGDGNCTHRQPEEEWREIPGYEGKYAVSNYGDVYSFPRTRLSLGKSKTPFEVPIPGGFKKQSLSHGYTAVNLSIDGKDRRVPTHILVASAFLGPRPDGMDVCHKDGDATNPELWNLRYDTRKSNMADCVEHGTHNKGEAHYSAKYSNEQILEVKRLLKEKTRAEVRTITGMSSLALCEIHTERKWKHIKLQEETI